MFHRINESGINIETIIFSIYFYMPAKEKTQRFFFKSCVSYLINNVGYFKQKVMFCQ